MIKDKHYRPRHAGHRLRVFRPFNKKAAWLDKNGQLTEDIKQAVTFSTSKAAIKFGERHSELIRPK